MGHVSQNPGSGESRELTAIGPGSNETCNSFLPFRYHERSRETIDDYIALYNYIYREREVNSHG